MGLFGNGDLMQTALVVPQLTAVQKPEKMAGWFVPHDRWIAGILAEVTIEEVERDEVTVTEHPVERGAPINDHAFKRPSEVVIRAGWSTAGVGDIGADNGYYGRLLALQALLLPFDLITGKRQYSDMLITGLTVTTDQTTEYTLMATIVCRQVILVSVSSTQVAVGQSSFEDMQANAQQTMADNKKGQTEPKAVSDGIQTQVDSQADKYGIGSVTTEAIVEAGAT